jgi:hypothetical protein
MAPTRTSTYPTLLRLVQYRSLPAVSPPRERPRPPSARRPVDYHDLGRPPLDRLLRSTGRVQRRQPRVIEARHDPHRQRPKTPRPHPNQEAAPTRPRPPRQSSRRPAHSVRPPPAAGASPPAPSTARHRHTRPPPPAATAPPDRSGSAAPPLPWPRTPARARPAPPGGHHGDRQRTPAPLLLRPRLTHPRLRVQRSPPRLLSRRLIRHRNSFHRRCSTPRKRPTTLPCSPPTLLSADVPLPSTSPLRPRRIARQDADPQLSEPPTAPHTSCTHGR